MIKFQYKLHPSVLLHLGEMICVSLTHYIFNGNIYFNENRHRKSESVNRHDYIEQRQPHSCRYTIQHVLFITKVMLIMSINKNRYSQLQAIAFIRNSNIPDIPNIESSGFGYIWNVCWGLLLTNFICYRASCKGTYCQCLDYKFFVLCPHVVSVRWSQYTR